MALSLGIKRCLRQLVGVRKLLKGYAQCRIKRSVRSFTSPSLYKPYTHKGPAVKPSILMQTNGVDNTIWDDIPIVNNDIFVCTPGKILICIIITQKLITKAII